MRPRLLLAIGAIAFSMSFSGAASAAPIVYGTPVADLSGTAVTSQITGTDYFGPGHDGIGMYIPLTAASSGTYGVGGVGTTVDNCYNGWNSGTCSGSMTMFLKFDDLDGTPNDPSVEVPGPFFMRFYFEDLDLIGANDPDHFLESITIKDQDGNTLGFFDTGGTTSVPTPPYSPGDYSYDIHQDGTQTLTLYNVYVPTDPFYAELIFTAMYPDECTSYDCDPYIGKKHWYNTIEYMSAEVEAWPPELVPVPAALPLFLSGLAAMGVVGVRRHKKQKAGNA